LNNPPIPGNRQLIITTDQINVSNYVSVLNNLTGKLAEQIKETDTLKSTLSSDKLLMVNLLASLENVDFAESASNLSNAQVAYQAALQVAARQQQMVSLFDLLQ
jgi:flagellin-like hook-associated protein FlgL